MSRPCEHDTSCGISPSFPRLSPSRRQIGHVLLTRPPLGSARRPSSYDLHVLGTPPAFVLSQDQTLHRKLNSSFRTRSLLTDSWSAADLTFGISKLLAHARRIARTEGLSAFRPMGPPTLSTSIVNQRLVPRFPGQPTYYVRATRRFPGSCFPGRARGPFGATLECSSCDTPERNAAAASLPRLAARAIRLRPGAATVNRSATTVAPFPVGPDRPQHPRVSEGI